MVSGFEFLVGKVERGKGERGNGKRLKGETGKEE
jgi:hypothetical protein